MGTLSTVNASSTIGSLMATSLVSGRVSEECRERAAFFIRRAGLTTSDVIRIVWENIAKTGEVPKPVEESAAGDQSLETVDNPLMRRFLELRATTPSSDFLRNLTPEGLKEELASRDI